MKDNKLNLASIQELVKGVLEKVNHFGLALFLIFVGLLYGFVFTQISSLSDREPTSLDIQNKINAARLPHIDQTVVDHLQALQDNSVNVKSLFNEARNNPFQE